MSSILKPLHIPGKRTQLTKRLIEEAQENTVSGAEAARWLGVTYVTYKKWSQYYGIFDRHKNQKGIGVKKGYAKTYKVNMEDIFNGTKNPKYTRSFFKKRLIDEGYMQEECSNCGYNEVNLETNKICLSLDFVDGDSKNKKYDNLRLLCPNCYYNNVGEFANSKRFCK